MFREIHLYYWRKVMESLRNPAFLIMGVMSPVLYLALFAPLLKNLAGSMGYSSENVLNMFVPGMFVMISFLGGFFGGFGIIDELRSGVIERFRVSPTSRFAMIGGTLLRDISAILLQTLFFVLLALPFGFRISVLGFILILILQCLLIATSSSFSYAMGLITKSEDKLAPIVHGLNLPILLLSGMLLPMSLAPTWLQVLAHCNPIYYVVEAARVLAAGDFQDTRVMTAFLVMIPLTLVVTGWATRVFRKAVM